MVVLVPPFLVATEEKYWFNSAKNRHNFKDFVLFWGTFLLWGEIFGPSDNVGLARGVDMPVDGIGGDTCQKKPKTPLKTQIFNWPDTKKS